MFEDDFARGDSIIHRLDPRAKLASAAAFSIVAAMIQRPGPLWAGLALAAGLVLLSRPPLAPLLRRLLTVNAFIAFLWLFLPFSANGEAAFSLGPLTATRPGLALATLITIKSNAIVLALMALVSTTPVAHLGNALRDLRMPDKLSHLLLFTYRFIFVIGREHQRLAAAMKIRGFRPGTNVSTYRAYAYLIGMVLVRSWERSERVYQAMLCRGFTGAFHSLHVPQWAARDLAFLGVMLTASAALALKGLTG